MDTFALLPSSSSLILPHHSATSKNQCRRMTHPAALFGVDFGTALGRLMGKHSRESNPKNAPNCAEEDGKLVAERKTHHPPSSRGSSNLPSSHMDLSMEMEKGNYSFEEHNRYYLF